MREVFPWPGEQQHSVPLPTDIIQPPSGDRMHSDKKKKSVLTATPTLQTQARTRASFMGCAIGFNFTFFLLDCHFGTLTGGNERLLKGKPIARLTEVKYFCCKHRETSPPSQILST